MNGERRPFTITQLTAGELESIADLFETPEQREAATWDDAEGSTCQHCDGQIPPERERCPTCGERSALV